MSFHSLSFRTFCQATEDEAKVVQALRFVTGAEAVERSVSEGYHGNKIIVLESAITSRKKIDSFFSRLSRSELEQILATLDSRVDEECALFFRLDKQDAYQEKLRLTSGEDVISVRGKIECYPKRRETALTGAREYFESIIAEAESR